MKNTKLYKFKYNRRKILLVYCDYNFGWYVIKRNGVIVICINNNYSKKIKSRLLHKAIKVMK